MKRNKKSLIILLTLVFVMAVLSSVLAVDECLICSSSNITRLANTSVPYDYSSCATTGCEITHLRVYWNYGCNECSYNWGVLHNYDTEHSIYWCPYQ